MSIFPANSYKLKSLAKPSEIASVLSAHVQPLPIVTRLGGHKTFAGSVSETVFRFVRVGETRNSFRPTIIGEFSADSQGTTINITIKHDAYFFIPLLIMFLLFASFSLQNSLIPLIIAFVGNNTQEVQKYLSPPFLLFLLSPIAMLFIGYFFGVMFFESEASAATKELTDILSPFTIKP
jgi:hypothetical protein